MTGYAGLRVRTIQGHAMASALKVVATTATVPTRAEKSDGAIPLAGRVRRLALLGKSRATMRASMRTVAAQTMIAPETENATRTCARMPVKMVTLNVAVHAFRATAAATRSVLARRGAHAEIARVQRLSVALEMGSYFVTVNAVKARAAPTTISAATTSRAPRT